jgi:diguanylate cyclase
MAINSQSKPPQPPLDIARETFKQMASQRIVPTPDNYERIYNQLAGVKTQDKLEVAIKKALLKLPNETTEQMKWVSAWNKLLASENWDTLPDLLKEGMDLSVNFSTQWPVAIRELIKSWEAKQIGLDSKKKKETLERVLIKFGNDPTLAQKLQNMAKSWMEYSTGAGDTVSDLSDNEQTTISISSAVIETKEQASANLDESDNGIRNRNADPFQQNFLSLQEVLRQSIKYGLIPRLDGYPELQAMADEIYRLADRAKKLDEWQLLVKKFRTLAVKVELIGATEEGIKMDLLRLLKLLVDNISELVVDDQWLRGQISVVQTIITSPLERATLSAAEKSMKEVIYKQGLLKHSLAEAKHSFKNMVSTFVDRLAYMSDSTGQYEVALAEFEKKMSETEDITVLTQLLENLMRDTHTMQADIVRSREDLTNHKTMVENAQAKIKNLEKELTTLSEQVRIDQLTGVLNRRGLDEALAREVSRVERTGGNLCVALLDIDNFKRLNDTYGHEVGDDALKHLATVVSETVRPTDIVTRFGGEEFVVLLPSTMLDDALTTMVRLQRALTKRFFMGNNNQILITFSAGVAMYKQGEDQATVLHRADQAMYLAKKTGKNKTMTENDLMVTTIDMEK